MSKTLNMVGGGAKGLFASIFAAGVSQTDTVTLTTPSGKVKSGKWTSRPNPAAHGLPAGYTELEYIGGNGAGTSVGAYINTGVKSGAGYTVKCKVSTPETGYKDDRAVLGVNGPGVASFLDDYNGTFGGYLGSATSRFTLMSVTINKVYDLKWVSRIGEQKIIIDGENYYTNSATSFLNYDVYLMAVCDGGSKAARTSKFRFHGETQIFDNDNNLIRDFYPCRRDSDGEIGMYDTVTNTFYGNAGTGEFSVGADVPASFDGFLFEKLGELGTYSMTAVKSDLIVTKEVLVDVVTTYNIEIEGWYKGFCFPEMTSLSEPFGLLSITDGATWYAPNDSNWWPLVFTRCGDAYNTSNAEDLKYGGSGDRKFSGVVNGSIIYHSPYKFKLNEIHTGKTYDDYYMSAFEMYGSNDGVTWEPITFKSTWNWVSRWAHHVVSDESSAKAYEYFKVTPTACSRGNVIVIRAYGYVACPSSKESYYEDTAGYWN